MDFFIVLAQVDEIVRQSIDVDQSHAAFDAAHDHFLPITAEVVFRARTQEGQDQVQLLRDIGRGGARSIAVKKIAVNVVDQCLGHPFRRQTIIHQAGSHRACRHPVEGGGPGVLG